MYIETIAQWNYNTRKVRAGDSASITAENRKEINLNCKIASKKKKKKEREREREREAVTNRFDKNLLKCQDDFQSQGKA